MKLKIRVIDVSEPESKGTGNRRYQQIQLTYRSLNDDKVGSKNLLSFSFPEVYKALSQSKKDDQFDVTLEKNDKGFWDWCGLGESGSDVSEPQASNAVEKSAKAVSYPASKSTYETPEERAVKQRLIVRQSSLAQAIILLGGSKADKNAVFILADEFVDWIYINPVHDEPEVV